MNDYLNDYDHYVRLAIKDLKENDYKQAEIDIKQAMLINPHSPVVHNLYGILEELLMQDNLARIHYRAAYALDPTYKPAIWNLDRISSFHYRYNKDIDFGENPEIT